ncbi:uncharacterized protein V1510DRAFT_363635 [Dipodascopsis tothii]|uniref:uncharacterized protein n=1 Tax=Dipodascopsis tothii TaxID=44089 RepID=UPI0034CD4AFC
MTADEKTVVSEPVVAGGKKPEQPDKAAFEAQLAVLQKDLNAKNDKLDAYRNQLKAASTDSEQSKRQQALKSELSTLRKRRGELRTSKQAVYEEIKTIDDSIKRKTKDIQAAKAKLNFKSVEELDKKIAELNATVDSGLLKLVDEKRMLNDITALKKARKTFGTFRESEASIAADREKIAALRAKADDPETKEIAAKLTTLQAELDGINAEFDKTSKNRTSLVEKRNEARKIKDEAYNALWKFKNEYYAQEKEYRKYMQEVRQKQWERRIAEREAQDKERRQARAAKKLEDASEPAFTAQIATAESLLAHFDPTFKPSTEGIVQKSSFAPASARQVALPDGVQVLSKKKDVAEDDYFVGKKGKKAKGVKKAAPAADEKKDDKFTLSPEIIDQLSKLSIGVPAAWDDVPAVVEKLKVKIEWFVDNQERVTAENIAKATAEIEKAEAEAASGDKEKRAPKRPAKAKKDAPAEDAPAEDAAEDVPAEAAAEAAA